MKRDATKRDVTKIDAMKRDATKRDKTKIYAMKRCNRSTMHTL